LKQKEPSLLNGGGSNRVKEAGVAGLAAGAAFPFILILGTFLWGVLWHRVAGEPPPGGSFSQNFLAEGYLALAISPWSTAIGGMLAVLLAGLFHVTTQQIGLHPQHRVRRLLVICMAIISAFFTYFIAYALWGFLAVSRLPLVNLPSTLASLLAICISAVWSGRYLRKTNP
jgi:hypothetical protein